MSKVFNPLDTGCLLDTLGPAENLLDVFWTSYVRSGHNPVSKGEMLFLIVRWLFSTCKVKGTWLSQ